ncbi:MAG: CvpA family protein [Calditerrivibrio sp.]|nr:CvpA family protein [Calditerrivibrio sp.]
MGLSGWDIFFLLIIAVFTIKGYLRGLIWEILRILGIIIAYLFSHQINPVSQKILIFFGFSEHMAKVFGFVLTFIIIFIVIIFISYILKKFFKAIKIGWIDSLGGAFFGFLKSVVIMSVLLSFLVSITPRSEFSKQLMLSPISSKIISINPYIYDIINKISGNRFSNPFNQSKKVL